MSNKILNTLKPTILSVIVAFLFTFIFFLGVKVALGQTIDEAITLLNYITIVNSEDSEPIVFDPELGLKNYPAYGKKYAKIEIPSIGVNLPVYFGDALELLQKGVGHSTGSYFPGEGGSIVYMGHNSQKVFRRFSELQKGDKIKVTTDYGKFTYKIYDMKLIKETEIDKIPIQKEKEILMVYTCYPFNNVGYASKRYVVYANLERNEN